MNPYFHYDPQIDGTNTQWDGINSPPTQRTPGRLRSFGMSMGNRGIPGAINRTQYGVQPQPQPQPQPQEQDQNRRRFAGLFGLFGV